MLSPRKGSTPLTLKVHFPPNVTKVVRFGRALTVRDAVQLVANKQDITDPEEVKQYGLFIPRHYQAEAEGWLQANRTLGSYGLATGDPVEFRKLWHELRIQDMIGRLRRVTVSDQMTIGELLPHLVKQISMEDIPLVDANHDELRKLNEDTLLLHLPLPHHTARFIVLRNGPLSEEMSDREIMASTALYLWLPRKEGHLLKKGDKGLVKAWKRRWFVLSGDRLFYFKTEQDGTPINYIAVQNVNLLQVTEPFDSATKRNPRAAFQLEAPGRVYYLLAESEEEQVSWTQVLLRWIEMRPFFGPARHSSMRLVRQPSSNLSGSQRANKKKNHSSWGRLSAKPRILRTREKRQSKEKEKQAKAAARAKAAGATGEGMDGSSSSIASPRRATIASICGEDGAEGEEEAAGEKRGKGTLMARDKFFDRYTEAEGDRESEEEMPREVVEREIRLVLTDGSIQPLIIDANVIIYDLVYAIAEAVGSTNASLISGKDQSSFRKVELLDHQRSLAEQNIPDDALFLLKKTGIVDEFIGPNDVYDNHFLYVQLPQLEGTFLMNIELEGEEVLSQPREGWRERWFSLCGNKLFYYHREYESGSRLGNTRQKQTSEEVVVEEEAERYLGSLPLNSNSLLEVSLCSDSRFVHAQAEAAEELQWRSDKKQTAMGLMMEEDVLKDCVLKLRFLLPTSEDAESEKEQQLSDEEEEETKQGDEEEDGGWTISSKDEEPTFRKKETRRRRRRKRGNGGEQTVFLVAWEPKVARKWMRVLNAWRGFFLPEESNGLMLPTGNAEDDGEESAKQQQRRREKERIRLDEEGATMDPFVWVLDMRLRKEEEQLEKELKQEEHRKRPTHGSYDKQQREQNEEKEKMKENEVENEETTTEKIERSSTTQRGDRRSQPPGSPSFMIGRRGTAWGSETQQSNGSPSPSSSSASSSVPASPRAPPPLPPPRGVKPQQ
ncbi:Cytohesin-1 [Balamuthia mandrillaris]